MNNGMKTLEEIEEKYMDGWWEGHDGYSGDDMYADIELLLAEIERLKGVLLHIDDLSGQFFNTEVIDGRPTFLLKPGLEKFSDFIHEIATVPYEAVNDLYIKKEERK